MEITKDLELKLEKAIFKKSYYEFFKDSFKVLHSGEGYNDNWHIEYLCGVLQEELFRIKRREVRKKDLIINMPFRSAKSLITTVMFPVWCWVIDPTIKIISVSYSANLALEHAQMSRNLIKSEWFQERWGRAIVFSDEENSKGFYRTTFGGFRKAVGTGGQITGSGADIIIVDDGQSPKKAASELERKNTKDFWDHTLYSRLNQLEIGLRINVQQRLAEDDLSGHLMEIAPDQFEHIRIPAEITPKATPLPVSLSKHYKNGLFWESRFSHDVLRTLKATLGSKQAAGQLQQMPAPEEGNIMKREWFDIVDPSVLERDVINHPLYFYVDTGDTGLEENDPYGLIAMYKKDNCVYISNVMEKHMEFVDACRFIPQYVSENKYSQNSKIKIEPKTAGKSIISQLKATTMLNVVELKPPKDDKITRVSAISPTCESRRVKFIKGDYVDKFLDQLCTFPNASHDDMVDAFTYGVTDLLMDGDFDFAFI